MVVAQCEWHDAKFTLVFLVQLVNGGKEPRMMLNELISDHLHYIVCCTIVYVREPKPRHTMISPEIECANMRVWLKVQGHTAQAARHLGRRPEGPQHGFEI